MAAGVLVEHQDAAAGQAHVAGVHDLVGLQQLEDAVLVDARLVAEGVGPHDGLVGLHHHPRQVGHQAAHLVELSGVHVGAQAEEVVAGPDAHHHLFQRGVARPLADAVDGALHLAGAGVDGGHAVGYRQAQVVVAVDGDDRLVDVGHVLLDAADERLELVGDGVAHGIGDVDGGGPGGDALLHQRVDVVGVGAGRVHG